jgi:SWIB/MDM2 domain
MKPLQPSTALAAIVGSSPLPRTEVVSKVWDYIKANNLQNPQNKREILADDKLQAIFGELRWAVRHRSCSGARTRDGRLSLCLRRSRATHCNKAEI